MNLDNGTVSEDSNNDQRTGEDHVVVNNKELEDMKSLQQKMNKDKLRKALLQKSIKDNSELLQRLSRT